MRFLISRTSAHSGGPPHPDAYQVPFTAIDIRTKLVRGWEDVGTNHRQVGDLYMRDTPAVGWFIDIPDLEALLQFVAVNGEIVLGPSWENPDILSLEIYDDYRE